MSTSTSPQEISLFIKELARENGFDKCGITKAEPLLPEANALKGWLESGYNGNMSYLSNNFEKRTNPALILDGARSVVVVALNYYTPVKQAADAGPIISRYASGTDYHLVVKRKLSSMMASLKESYPHINGRFYVDSAPLLEKPLAARAGIGWQGKNSLLIADELGSFVFLGELVLDTPLEYDKPYATDRCGNCTRCISSCPTGAISGNRTIDARRCISYLTVELQGSIPEEFAGMMENRLFGCDICQDVCPWNKDHAATETGQFMPLDHNYITPEEWDSMDEERLKKMIEGTSMERAGAKTILQNYSILRRARL